MSTVLRPDFRPTRVVFVTPDRDHITIPYPPNGVASMAASKAKTILFSRTTVGKAVHLHPIAVFNLASDAKAYATFLKLAHRAKDVEAAKSLDPATVVDEEGKLAGETKWSLTEVPYCPVANFGDDDDEVTEPAAT